MIKKYDIVVIGAGINGLTISSALAENGFEVALIDKDNIDRRDRAIRDGRGISIARHSRDILEKYKIWDFISQSFGEIHNIIIKDSNALNTLQFSNKLVQGEPLGFIIESDSILNGMYEKVSLQKNIHAIPNAECKDIESEEAFSIVKLSNGDVLEADLVIVADGKNSSVRSLLGLKCSSKDYNQSALVFNIEHSIPHNNSAYEYFFTNGPFAALPLANQNHSSIVWTEKNHISSYSLTTEELSQFLQERCFGTHGSIKIISSVSQFPLSLSRMKEYYKKNVVFIGDCLHSIHPLAGQGYNLSLRDIDKLVELLVEYKSLGLNIGSQTMLKNFQQQRQMDNLAMIAVTDNINRVFSNNISAIKLCRRFGLEVVSSTPKLQKLFMNYAMGKYA